MSDPHPTRPRRGVTSKASMIGVLRSLFRPARPAPAGHATDLDRQMMARAIELARRAADLGEVPVGAVVVKDGYLPLPAAVVAKQLELLK